MENSIEYTLVTFLDKEVWKCATCKRYRHRPANKAALPAICCGSQAKLIDKYSQPREITVQEPIAAQ